MKHIFRNVFLGLLISALVAACAAREPSLPLNSERIEARFGSYGVDILEQNSSRRVTCLYSGVGPDRRCRTLAIVRFEDPAPAPLREPLRQIREGASLGATLSAAGWRVEKVNRHLGAARIENLPVVAGYFPAAGTDSFALHIYDLNARNGRNGDTVLTVAQLLEVHDPAYLDDSELLQIYADLPQKPLPDTALDAWLNELSSIPAAR